MKFLNFVITKIAIPLLDLFCNNNALNFLKTVIDKSVYEGMPIIFFYKKNKIKIILFFAVVITDSVKIAMNGPPVNAMNGPPVNDLMYWYTPSTNLFVHII